MILVSLKFRQLNLNLLLDVPFKAWIFFFQLLNGFIEVEPDPLSSLKKNESDLC